MIERIFCFYRRSMATFVLCKRDFLQHETRRKMTRRRNELKRKRRGERCFRTKLSYFILAVHALSLHPSINPSVARSEKINSKKKNFYKRRIVEEGVKEKKKRTTETFEWKFRILCTVYIVTFIHKSIHCKRSRRKKNSRKRVRSKDSYENYCNSITIETMIVKY